MSRFFSATLLTRGANRLAEMALATLQGVQVPGANPPIALALSHAPELSVAAPPLPLLSQFVQSDLVDHPLRKASPQDVFRWFRGSGPLVSVRTDVDVGHKNRTCVIEHWEEEHAIYAKTQRKSLHAALKAMPGFTLRIFDPCNLYCAVSESRIPSPAIQTNSRSPLFCVETGT